MQLTLFMDCRCRYGQTALARSFLSVTTEQVSNLLSLCHLTRSRRPLRVRLVLVHPTTVSVPVEDLSLCESGPGLQRLLSALSKTSSLVTETETPLGGAVYCAPNMALLQPYLYQNPSGSAARGAARASDVYVFATAFVPYTELFSGLPGATGAPLPYTLHCVTADAESVGVAAASLGTSGSLYCTSLDPGDVRSALQAALSTALLLDTSVPVTLRLGAGVAVACTARRPYLDPPPRFCTADHFPGPQEERPSVVLQGCSGGVRLLQSDFELSRFGTDAHVAASLSLEAVLPPENVEETFLSDNTWVLAVAEAAGPVVERPDAAKGVSPTALFDAAFTQFSADALVLRCVGAGSTRLAQPGHMALQSACYVGYFLDRSRLLLRQLTPPELRRARAIPQRQRCATTDSAVTSLMHKLRTELVARCAAPDFSLDALAQGGICLVATQLREDKEYSLQLVKLFH